MNTWKVVVGFLFFCHCAMSMAGKAADKRFDVSFINCKEYVAFGPISLAKAQAMLPHAYTASDTDGFGGVVVRTSACEMVSVENAPQRPAIVAHYGINIDSVDGSGDINNYTLVYVSDYPALVAKFREIGMPAIYSPNIAAEDPATLPGDVYISIFGLGLIPYSISGVVSEAVGPEFPFSANWWYQGKFGAIKQSTNFPLISFGAANFELQTTSASELGQLIGGNTDSNFPWYNVRGEFAQADMQVTLE